MSAEREILINYLTKNKKRISKQRLLLLNTFLKYEKHLSPQEIYREVRKKYPHIGMATVYRTLKLFSEAQLADVVKFEDGRRRYEHKYAHPHHDHFICTICGKATEFVDKEIEKIQRLIAKKYKFQITSHNLAIYGICQRCCTPGV